MTVFLPQAFHLLYKNCYEKYEKIPNVDIQWNDLMTLSLGWDRLNISNINEGIIYCENNSEAVGFNGWGFVKSKIKDITAFNLSTRYLVIKKSLLEELELTKEKILNHVYYRHYTFIPNVDIQGNDLTRINLVNTELGMLRCERD